MIRPVIHDAEINKAPPGVGYTHTVVHPANGAVLAYCDSKEEAVMYREVLNDLPRQLREVGMVVR